jgi:endonuclease YncB( thermonuclease family)
MVKCQRRKSLQKNPSQEKDKRKGYFPRQKKRRNAKKGLWFQDGNKKLCSYYGKSGHQIEKF